MFVSSWGSGWCTYCHVWGAGTQNSVRRVVSVGLGRGHACIRKHSIWSLYLRFPPGFWSLLLIHLPHPSA